MITILILTFLSLVQSKRIAQAQASIQASRLAIAQTNAQYNDYMNEKAKKAFQNIY